MDLRKLAMQAREKCQACKHDIVVKRLPTSIGPNDDELVHLDLFATYEAGQIYKCDAIDILEKVITGYDDNNNPVYVDGWEKIMEELCDADNDSERND